MSKGGSSGNQTVTQQNIPDWAMNYAQNTLDMGRYYTNNQDYRPSTLDRDYSGIRGYNAQGQPNSQVGQFGLNPMPAQPMPQPMPEPGGSNPRSIGPGVSRPIVPSGFDGAGGDGPLAPSGFDGAGRPDMQSQRSTPTLQQPTSQAAMFEMARTNPEYAKNMDLDQMFGATEARQIRQNLGLSSQAPQRQLPPGTGLLFADEMPSSGVRRQTGGPLLRRPVKNLGPDSFRERPGGRTAIRVDDPSQPADSYSEIGGSPSPSNTSNSGYQGVIGEQGSNITNDPDPTQNTGTYDNTNTNTTNTSDSSSNTNNQTTLPAGMSQEEVQALIDEQLQQFDANTITPDEMPTPFQAYDRQRFAAPGANTLRGEGILADRYDQRFGEGGTDPFAAANQAVGSAANYQSGFQGTMGEGGLGGQAGNYQQGLGSATNPNVFQSGNYTSGLPNFANPNADMRNVNAGIGNVNAGVQNVNAGLRSQQFGNANQGLQGPVNYQQERSLRDSMQQFQDPYTDRVVNQTIKDMDRARQMTANQISGDSAKAGAYGGSRSMLMQAENNRNFADRTAAAVGQLRSQGFQRAADLAQQENLQRLGLSASDVQNVRGLQSQGNLQGQNLTARDLQDVRGLQSQGALTAQGLRSQGALTAQGLQSQGGLAAQGLQSQGALAALGANAGLYQSALGLNAAGDRSAMGYNAGLLSDAMGLDAADLNQRRNLASNEAQFAETANRGAGALNLQGGQALGQLAQAGTADERQRIADILAAGGAGDARNQQDLDFIFSEFNRELDYPGRQIDLRNAAISPATGSIVTTTQPRYSSGGLPQAAGAGLATYGMLAGIPAAAPYALPAALAMGLLNY